MNAQQKGLLLWASAPVAAYLLRNQGWFIALAGAAGASYLAYMTVLSSRERSDIVRFARTAGYVGSLANAISG